MGHPVEGSAALAQQDVRFDPRRVEKPWGYELIWAHDVVRVEDRYGRS